MEILDFYREAVKLHHVVKCLRMGSMKPLVMGKGYISYARFDQRQCAVVVIHAGTQPLDIEIPVWEAGIGPDGKMTRVLSTSEKACSEPADISGGMLSLSLPPHSGCVYTATRQRLAQNGQF